MQRTGIVVIVVHIHQFICFVAAGTGLAQVVVDIGCLLARCDIEAGQGYLLGVEQVAVIFGKLRTH